MHPAPSVIVFTVLSGLGFGLFIWLGFGWPVVTGVQAFVYYTLAYFLSVGGLIASSFHLGNPKNAYKSFSQWRTSWLSREAWLAVLSLLLFAVVAIAAIFFQQYLIILAYIAAISALATVLATSMIYAQLKTVPRWHHYLVPVYFLSLSFGGGAVLAGQHQAACLLLLLIGVVQVLLWMVGDQQFAKQGATMETATGLGRIGKVRLFEPPHTGTNYLLNEMVYVLGRKHANKLRMLALLLLSWLPLVILLLLPESYLTTMVVALIHLSGAVVSRWLFFAEAEHVVGLYYGQ